MKFFTIIATLALAGTTVLAGCSGKSAKTDETTDVAEATTPRDQLIDRLGKIQATGKYAFGHHDDTAYGHDWTGVPDRSDVKDVTGDYPGIMNWDLGLIEWGAPVELDGVSFDFIRSEAAKQHARGGLNTVSWHPRNPATKGDSWNTEGGNVVKECVTEGTALNDTVKVWIARAADFIGSLKDASGNRIPVVFRPWHEHTGSWFWWGGDNTDADSYKALWRLTRKVFDEKGIDNVVWAYSPDKITNEEEYMAYYPGDEYIDIMGADVYCFGDAIDEYRDRVKTTLSIAQDQATKRGKLLAFTETGQEGLPTANWYTEVLMPLVKESPIVYVTVWRNADKEVKPGHFYAPYPGHPAEDSFKAFYADSITLFAKELSAIK